MEQKRNRRLRESFIRGISDIIRRMKDERLNASIVTICDAKVSSDGSFCKAYVSSLKGISHAKKMCKVLNYASGHIQTKMSSILKTRVTPKILFLPSGSGEYAFKIEKIILMNKLDDKNRLYQICNFFKENNNFALYTHENPDGDAVGACTALCLALQKMGKNAQTFYGDDFNCRFSFLRNFLPIINESDSECTKNICLDVCERKRLGKFKNKNFDVCIDHHDIFLCNLANLCYIDKNYSSASEIIYDIIQKLGIEIDEKIATCIYAGIIWDTGCFKWSNTSERTFEIASEIFGKVDRDINRKLFGNISKNLINFQGEIIKKFEYFGQCCSVFVSFELWNSFELNYSDLSFLSSFPLEISGVEISIVVKEFAKNQFKVSVRSRSGEAIKLCKIFGGGGHNNASGFEFFGNYDELRSKILGELGL